MQMHTDLTFFANGVMLMSKCSIQDIANALGYSRNTVSKAINGKEGVSPETRKIILDKASEMRYMDFLSNYETLYPENNGSFLFLTKASPHSEYWLEVMKGIEETLEGSHFSLQLGVINEEDFDRQTLPKNILEKRVQGLIIVEICNLDFIKNLLALDLPIVSVDCPSSLDGLTEKIDIITMENKNIILDQMKKLQQKGLKSFSFAGNISGNNVSNGFMERYNAFLEGIESLGLAHYKAGDLTMENDRKMLDIIHLVHFFKNLEHIPDCYICGNDWTALRVANALKLVGIKIPDQVSIIGFDNIEDSETFDPPLTTINTPKRAMGRMAGQCLLNKVLYPNTPTVMVTFQTELVLRNSTR
jgi:LacI family transcriptional regulator